MSLSVPSVLVVVPLAVAAAAGVAGVGAAAASPARPDCGVVQRLQDMPYGDHSVMVPRACVGDTVHLHDMQMPVPEAGEANGMNSDGITEADSRDITVSDKGDRVRVDMGTCVQAGQRDVAPECRVDAWIPPA